MTLNHDRQPQMLTGRARQDTASSTLRLGRLLILRFTSIHVSVLLYRFLLNLLTRLSLT